MEAAMAHEMSQRTGSGLKTEPACPPDHLHRSAGGARTEGLSIRRYRGWSALVLLGSLVLGACGTSPAAPARTNATGRETRPPAATTSFAAAGCPTSAYGPTSDEDLLQEMNGQVLGCVRVGVLDPGAYRVVLEQVASRVGKDPATGGAKTPVPSAEPAVALTLSPASGTPGSRVTVTGRLASPISDAPDSSARLPFAAWMCWDGCANGLQYEGVQLHWISPTQFRAALIVPGAPWFERDSDQVHRLVSGSYSLSVECLDLSKGCGLGAAEGSASFRLRVPASAATTWCRTAPSCARLTVTPGAALPGDVVKVTGYAPLLSVIGSSEPFVFQFDVLRGHPSGPEVSFKAISKGTGAVFIYLGHGALKIEALPTWKSLRRTIPLAEVDAGLPSISPDPADSSLVAWCGPGTVTVSDSGNQTQFPTAAAVRVLKHMDLGTLGVPPPACDTAIPLGVGSSVNPPVVVVAFGVAPNQTAPPTAEAALITTDGGRTWTPLPVPPGASPITFGGFQDRGRNLEALFAPARLSGQFSPPLVEASSDGGRHWHSMDLACPAKGPCVTFGAYVSGNCAGGALISQAILRSTDRGGHWTEPGWPSWVDPCAPAQLVATSTRTELLVDSDSANVLLRSTDAGATWADVKLPALPGEVAEDGFGPGSGGITVLSNGTLLATGGSTNSWELLRPGATSWCVASDEPSQAKRLTEYTPVVVIGAEIWWLSESDQSSPVAHHLARVSGIAPAETVSSLVIDAI